MKYIPTNLEHLELHLWNNNLGKFEENMMYFKEGMRLLPK